jgi:hypothetical protein
MSVIHYKGITWEVNGVKDGKGILTHQGTTITYDKAKDAFQFCQGEEVILARNSRGDTVRDATDCILDSYAAQFIPSWEADGSAQASS